MKTIMTLFLAAAMLFAIAGCDELGFRLDPNESQKRSAAAGRDIATINLVKPLPPGSAASRQMVDSAAAAANYAGPPANPVDVMDLIPASDLNAWDLKNQQIAAMKVREKLYANAAKLTTAKFATLLESLTTGDDKTRSIDANFIFPQIAAIADINETTAALAEGIDIPKASGPTTAESAALAEIKAEVKKINAAAALAASKRLSATDVANRTGDAVLKVVDDNPGLAGIIGTTGIGGVILGFLRSRKKTAAKIAAASDSAKSAADVAINENTVLKSIIASKSADAQTAMELAKKVTDDLAKSIPAPNA